MGRSLTFVLWSCIYVCTYGQPHGLIQISDLDPSNPIIKVNEEDASIITITVERIGGCKYPAEVGFRCLERTAKNGLDFECHYKRLKWNDEECSKKSVFVTIHNDNEYEEDEDFLFQLYAVNDEALGFDRVLIVIEQNDVSKGEISIEPSIASVIEGMNVEFKIKRNNGKIGTARVCYQVIPGTAKLEFDVEYAQDCIEWKHNDDQVHLINIVTLPDDLWEGNETFYVKLLNAESATISSLYSQTNVTILQNNLNTELISTTFPPCIDHESKKEIQIDPTKQEFFVQFEVRLPSLSTVNNAHIIAQQLTESSLKWIVFRIRGILVNELLVSCDNIPSAYEFISYPQTIDLNCDDIIQHTVIIDNNVNYTCNLTAVCTNFDPIKHHPKYININTSFTKRKQRLICENQMVGFNNISCECDFPQHIYNRPDEWVLSNLSVNNKYLSYSVGNDILQMTQQSRWNNHSLATFLVEIRGYEIDKESKHDNITDWSFRLITDAYPCKETNWTKLSECNVPVGIGYTSRSRILVDGFPGDVLKCHHIVQHERCTVNQEKSISFSRTEVRVQEGDDGTALTIRLNHELNNTVNRSELTMDEQNALKGYDIILIFEIPTFFQKEIVIDPLYVGWKQEKWDTVHEIKITALDDMNIDALEQTIVVNSNIHSIDKEYNDLIPTSLTVIVEDNEKCRYCGIGSAIKFDPPVYPTFWDTQSIIILIVSLLMIMYILWSAYRWFKRKYGRSANYESLKNDGLINETEQSDTDSYSNNQLRKIKKDESSNNVSTSDNSSDLSSAIGTRDVSDLSVSDDLSSN